MYAMLLVAVATLGADLLPIPTGDELAQAEKTVQDVFGDEMKAAKTAKQKSEVANKMLETAAGSEPAGRYVLLNQARDLAAEAGDGTMGIQAVQGLVDGFAPERSQDPAAWASRGHHLWGQGADKRSGEGLKMRLEAAENYLRAMEGLEGFQKTVIEQRLEKLGWRPGRLSPREIVDLFGIPDSEIHGDTVVWVDATRRLLSKKTYACAAADFSFRIRAVRQQMIRARINGREIVYAYGVTDNTAAVVWTELATGKSKVVGLGRGAGDTKWHSMRMHYDGDKLVFFYDGEEVYTEKVSFTAPVEMQVGFGDHDCRVSIKDVHFTYR